MKYIKKIYPFVLPYKKYAFLNIFANIFYALFSTLSMVALIPMLKVMFGEGKPITETPKFEGLLHLGDFFNNYSNYYITTTSAEKGEVYTLTILVVLIISLFLLKNLFNYMGLFYIAYLRNGVLKDLRDKLYKKIVELPISFYSEKRKGDIIARMTSDVQEVQNSFLAVLELIVKEPLTIIFTIVMMVVISPQLTLFVFIFIPISGYIISLIGKQLKKKSDKVQQENGHILSNLEETLSGLKIIKAFNAEGRFTKFFQQSTQRHFHFSNDLMHRKNLASPVSEFLGIIVIAILLLYGGRMVILDGSLDGASFIAYMGLAYNILTPAKAISKASYGVKKGNAAAERVLSVLETKNPIHNKENAIKKENFENGISIKNISFRYDDYDVLKNFSIEVPKGKTIALVGQSGSGKSTIANLVTRFYDIERGEILIDNTNIKDINKESLRNLMGMVTQDAILFNDTIKNNILMAKENATDQEIIEALKIANAWEFVSDLPKGIDTNIGDSGNKLSGGQKQRISIARAVLKNPPIMILDEATSALDTESEKLVQKALENMMKNRTSIVIAHRLSTIQNADNIIVMQRGEIVEQGKHNELLTLNGTYKNLVEMQSFE
ncbi:ABC transporter ATP-binding protein [Mesonia mobilis]|uniref:Antibiotic ABC transporter ATP-binding protein n=1 Tax=Mesonia mobilis TaxID=369791 RepID=A0ABQ3BRS2_9FLAO|nr:ABC transporter ATP-binding protein [Mesonia mobilis]MBQ0737926.1 ABC transporter ATP-binding protein [Aquimarina celericrescens]GGZ51191.1 antibiotic ABC transporter ATP-binding protein [Mesonia mobilis]